MPDRVLDLTASTPVLLMALRGDEAEPVLVILEGRAAVLVLDDGDRLVFDAVELRAAVGVPVALRTAA